MFQNSLKHAYVRNQEFTKFIKLSHPIDDLYMPSKFLSALLTGSCEGKTDQCI